MTTTGSDPAVLSLEDLRQLGEGKPCIECEGTGWACQPPRCSHPLHVQCPWCHGTGKSTGAFAAAPTLLASAIHYAQEAERRNADTPSPPADRSDLVAMGAWVADCLDAQDHLVWRTVVRRLVDAAAERDAAVARAERFADELESLTIQLVRAAPAESLLDRARPFEPKLRKAAEWFDLVDRLLARITIEDESGARLAADLGSGTDIQDDLRDLADLLTPTTEEGDDG